MYVGMKMLNNLFKCKLNCIKIILIMYIKLYIHNFSNNFQMIDKKLK